MKRSIITSMLLVVFLAGCASHGVTYIAETHGGPKLPNGGSRKILVMVPPEYPSYLRMKRIAGIVIVRLWVRPDGKVERAEARYSSYPDLIPLATDAVYQWVFEPAAAADKRFMVLEMPVTFALREADKTN